MTLANWPLYAMFGGAFGMATSVIGLFAGLVTKRIWLGLSMLGLFSVCAVAVHASLDSPYWEKPECYPANGQLDESRAECRLW